MILIKMALLKYWWLQTDSSMFLIMLGLINLDFRSILMILVIPHQQLLILIKMVIMRLLLVLEVSGKLADKFMFLMRKETFSQTGHSHSVTIEFIRLPQSWVILMVTVNWKLFTVQFHYLAKGIKVLFGPGI